MHRLSVFWLAVRFAVSHCVELHTLPEVSALCGDEVTLPCDASSSGQLEVKYFSWVGNNTILCEYDQENEAPEGFQCNHTSTYSLNLTIKSLMPVHEGVYICKLRSTAGAESNKTTVTVKECLGSYNSAVNESHATCWFSEYYPHAAVHWFRGDSNVTDSSSTVEETDRQGLHTVSSTIQKTENQKQDYRCSLWIPSLQKSLISLPIEDVKIGRAFDTGSVANGASRLRLQWISVLLLLTVTSIM